jgi:hypothetical protein
MHGHFLSAREKMKDWAQFAALGGSLWGRVLFVFRNKNLALVSIAGG